jgi:CDP-6-deoxy-D-xylo-4-hexulose-3-dehydrase
VPDEKLQQILDLVKDYIKEKHNKEKHWKPGEDWLAYSGPIFTEDEYEAAVKQLLSGWLIFGQQGRNFELEFSKEMGKKHGLLTNSGSSANLLMTAALTSKDPYISKRWDLKKGSKFITPVVCFPTTINPIIQCGFEPVFVDVTLPDLNLDLDQVEDILKSDKKGEIRGIVFAHVLGNPPNMERLMHLVKKYNLIFLEDCCDALGSTYDGKKLGSFGDISTCSFFPAHHMTLGEGGFVATNSAKMRQILASFRDWGRACYCNSQKPGNVTDGTACGNRFKSWFKGAPEVIYDHRYVFNEIGYNIKPLDLQAAIGLEQIKKLDEFHEARKKNHKRLYEIFKPYEEYFYLNEATEKADPSWFAFLLTVKNNNMFKKFDFVNHLESAKIQTRSYFSGNILYHPGYTHLAKGYGNLKDTFPVAHKVTTSSFFLGTFAGITDEKLDYIKEVVEKYFK